MKNLRLKSLVAINLLLLITATVIATGYTIGVFIDIPSIMLMLPFIALTVILSKEKLDTMPIYVGGIIITLIGAVSMLLNMSDPSAIGPSSAVAILPIVYAIVIDGFILRPIYILKQNQLSSKENVYSSKALYITHIIAVILILVIMQISVGVGPFIDIPSLILVVLPVSATAILASSHYHKMLLIKNYAFYGFFASILIYAVVMLLDFPYVKLGDIGPRMAFVMLSGLYALYIYSFIFKPIQKQYTSEVSRDEVIFLFAIATAVALVMLVLISHF